MNRDKALAKLARASLDYVRALGSSLTPAARELAVRVVEGHGVLSVTIASGTGGVIAVVTAIPEGHEPIELYRDVRAGNQAGRGLM